jgi:hypothetical protein
MKEKDEQEFADKVKAWLENNRYKDKRSYTIIANVKAHNNADVRVLKKGTDKLVLQIETKIDDYYKAIGEAFSYYHEYEVPTFVAVPYSTMKTSEWDFNAFIDLFKYYKVKIGVLVMYDNNKFKPEYDPLKKLS